MAKIRADLHDNGAFVIVIQAEEAKWLMNALATNGNCPEMDDLLAAMRNPRKVRRRSR